MAVHACPECSDVLRYPVWGCPGCGRSICTACGERSAYCHDCQTALQYAKQFPRTLKPGDELEYLLTAAQPSEMRTEGCGWARAALVFHVDSLGPAALDARLCESSRSHMLDALRWYEIRRRLGVLEYLDLDLTAGRETLVTDQWRALVARWAEYYAVRIPGFARDIEGGVELHCLCLLGRLVEPELKSLVEVLRSGSSWLDGLVNSVFGHCRFDFEAAFGHLLPLVRDPDLAVRSSGWWALSAAAHCRTNSEGQTLEQLEPFLRQVHTMDDATLAAACGRARQQSKGEPRRTLRSYLDEDVRADSAILQQLDDAKSGPRNRALRKLLELGQGGAPALPKLIALTRRTEGARQLRSARLALKVLEQLDDVRAAEYLQRLAQCEGPLQISAIRSVLRQNHASSERVRRQILAQQWQMLDVAEASSCDEALQNLIACRSDWNSDPAAQARIVQALTTALENHRVSCLMGIDDEFIAELVVSGRFDTFISTNELDATVRKLLGLSRGRRPDLFYLVAAECEQRQRRPMHRCSMLELIAQVAPPPHAEAKSKLLERLMDSEEYTDVRAHAARLVGDYPLSAAERRALQRLAGDEAAVLRAAYRAICIRQDLVSR